MSRGNLDWLISHSVCQIIRFKTHLSHFVSPPSLDPPEAGKKGRAGWVLTYWKFNRRQLRSLGGQAAFNYWKFIAPLL